MTALSSTSLQSILPHLPDDITTALETEFAAMESRFASGDWGPAELNGGRFAEALLRFLEWRYSGSYTPMGMQVSRSKILGEARKDTSLADSLRFHVSKCTEILMDIRNKRDVAHLDSNINVNEMDARLVMRLAAWSLAEIIREETALSITEAQNIIDQLSAKRIPLVEEIEGDLIVLSTNLTARENALIALYHVYPKALRLEELQEATRYQNSSRFRSIMDEQARKGLIHLKDDTAYLTQKGIVWVEQNVDMKLDL